MISKIYNRADLLQSLIQFKNTEFIKVITGVRRCGKSTLLLLYKNYLIQKGATEKQLIYLSCTYP